MYWSGCGQYRSGVGSTRIDSREEFARQLTIARERVGLTVREVAKTAGIPGSTAGGFFSGRHVPALRPPDVLIRILAACGICGVDDVGQWLDAARRVRRVPGRRSAARPAPYRGLAGFQVEDGEWFFGRERLVGELIGRLTAVEPASQPLMVIGPSGCGKSSLLRAGLVPALLASGMGEGSCRPEDVTVFTPGEAPVRSLVAHLVSTADQVDDIVCHVLREPSWLARSGSWREAIVIIVDQFEEVFTACTDDGQRRAFIYALAAIAGADGGSLGARVVIGMRADFYAPAMRYRPLAGSLQESQVLVGPMTTDEMRRAVLQPACRAGIEVEAGLVEVLLKDLERMGGTEDDLHEVGALPLLSHALLITWENGRGRELTVAGYRETGGIRGAVAQSAEQVFQDLSARQQDVARRLFVRLVHVRDDTPDTRRRVRHDELTEHDSDEYMTEDAENVQVVLERYVCARLVTSDMDGLEIAHEALVSAWPRLRRWIDADREGLAVVRRVTDAAGVWELGGRDPDLLLGGVRLAQVREWFDKPGHTRLFTQLERAFVRACIDHERVQLKVARRRRRTLYEMVTALTVLAAVLAMLTVYSVDQRRQADSDRDQAVSRQFAGVAAQQRAIDSALAAQFALAGHRLAPTVEARSALLDASATPLAGRMVVEPGVVLQAVSVTADGRRLAIAGADGLVHLRDPALAGRSQRAGDPIKVADSPVYSIAFSPNGNVLATAGGDRKVQLWDVTNTGSPTLLNGDLAAHTNTIYSIAYSPTGGLLVSGSADATVRFWNVSDPTKAAAWPDTPIIHGAAVHSVDVNGTGTLAASGSDDGTVQLWDLTAAEGPRPVGGPITITTREVRALTFAPHTPTLAVGTSDGKVQVWDVAEPAQPRPLGSPTSTPQTWIQSLAFSDRGDRLAAASSDNSLWVWDSQLNEVVTMRHPAPVTGVAFQPAGTALVTAAADGIVRIWQLSNPVVRAAASVVATAVFDIGAERLLTAAGGRDAGLRLWSGANHRRPTAISEKLTAVAPFTGYTGAGAIHPNGELLAVGGVDHGIQLWNASDPTRPTFTSSIVDDNAKVIQSMIFNPAGDVLAAGGDDNLVRLWSIADPKQPALLATLHGPAALVLVVAFSPDGKFVAAGSADNTIRLWDVSDPRRPVLASTITGAKSYVYAVAFNPNGAMLAAGSADKTVRLWDVSNPTDPRPIGDPLIGPSNYVYTVAFSPDGGLLAAGSGDHDIRLWDVRTPTKPSLYATLTAADGAVWSVAFSADGKTLAASDSTGTLRTWTTDPATAAKEICDTIGDDLTPAEWNQFAPSTPYNPPCERTN